MPVSTYIVSNITQLNHARNQFYRENGREASAKELSKITGISLDKVKDMLTLVREPLSLEMTMDNDRDTRLMDFVADDSYSADPSNACQLKELNSCFEQMMTVLNERERRIINLRYGFDGEKKTTFADIGKMLGVTRERARQLEAKAILKLRRTDHFKEVQCFFEE